MRIDNKITKDRLDHHLEYDWFKYVAILLAAILVWWFVYDTVDKLKSHQQIEIFGVNLQLDSDLTLALNQDFVRYLNEELADPTVKNVTISSDSATYNGVLTGERMIMELLSTRFATNDLVIADEEFFGYLAYSGRLAKFDKADEGQEINGFNYQGVFGVTDKLEYNENTAYYVLDEPRFAQYSKDLMLYDGEGAMASSPDDIKLTESRKDKIFGIELNALVGDANGLLFPFPNVLDEEGKPTATKVKYYIGVVLSSLMGSSSGANKGQFNVGKESKDNAQAFDFIRYLIDNAAKYKI